MVNTPEKNILDMPAEITQQAPIYGDLKTKQIAVKGAGSQRHARIQLAREGFQALDPGQFWYADDFFKGGVVLEENLADQRAAQALRESRESPGSVQGVRRGRGSRFTWKTAHLTGAEACRRRTRTQPRIRCADHGFPDLGRTRGNGFETCLRQRAVPTPEIQAKANDITKNSKTESEKIKAIK